MDFADIMFKSIVTTCSIMSFVMLLMMPDKIKQGSDYQIDIKNDSATIYDGSRLVGSCKLNQIDSLIITDNQ